MKTAIMLLIPPILFIFGFVVIANAINLKYAIGISLILLAFEMDRDIRNKMRDK